MKITIVTGPFFPTPPAPCGAVERLWHQLAIEFVRQGHEVAILGRSHPDFPPDQLVDGVRVLRHGGFPQTSILPIDLVTDFLYSLFQIRSLPPSDVIITNVFWLPALLSRIFKRSTPVAPTIGTMPKGQIFLYHRCAALFAPSEAVKKAILRQCPKAEPLVVVVPNPIDTHYFHPPAQARDFSGAKHFIFAGRIHPGKNILMLVRAFAKIARRRQDVDLRIIGPWERHRGGGGEAYRSQILQLAKDLPIELREPIYDRAQLAAEFQRAHIFCLPSVSEAFGVAPIEAMAAGAVPVISNLLVFHELIPEDVGYFFDHESSDAEDRLARTFEAAIDNPAELSKRSELAAQAAMRFGITDVAAQYLSIMKRLAASK